MRCVSCNAENSDDRRFCGACGTPLAAACSDCGFTNQPGIRFCGGCGQKLHDGATPAAITPSPAPVTYTPKHLADKILTSQAAISGERKQVTVLFADIKGSLELIEGSDPEQAHNLLDSAIGSMAVFMRFVSLDTTTSNTYLYFFTVSSVKILSGT